MNATVVELRYKTRAILDALERRESVQILYHGKVKGTLVHFTMEAKGALDLHPFFGSAAPGKGDASATVRALRSGRYRAL